MRDSIGLESARPGRLEHLLALRELPRDGRRPEAARARQEVEVEGRYRAVVAAVAEGRADVIAAALDGIQDKAGRVGAAVDCARAALAGLTAAEALRDATPDTAAGLVKQSAAAQAALAKELGKSREARPKDVALFHPERGLEQHSPAVNSVEDEAGRPPEKRLGKGEERGSAFRERHQHREKEREREMKQR